MIRTTAVIGAVFLAGCNLILGGYKVGEGSTSTGATSSISTSGPGGSTSTTSNVSGSTGTGSGPVMVQVTPPSVSLIANQFYGGFAATVTGATDTAVTWTIDEAPAGGAIDGPTSAYFASSGAGMFKVRATSKADPSKYAEAMVTVSIPQPTTIATGYGAIGYAVGLPHQNHLTFVDETKEWWFFYLDAAKASAIRSTHSTDFVNWVGGPDLTFPDTNRHNGQGENFALATFTGTSTASPFSHFVYVHQDLSDTTGSESTVASGTCNASAGNFVGGATEVRLAYGPATFQEGTPSELVCANGGSAYPDGPSAALIPAMGGVNVEIATGYTGTGAFLGPLDSDPTQPAHNCGFEDGGILDSAGVDTGNGLFTPAWATDAAWCVPGTATSRQVLWDGTKLWYFGTDGEPVLYGYRKSFEVWDHTNYMSMGLTPPAFPNGSQAASDWMAMAAGSKVHVVRRNDSGGLDHAVTDQTGMQFMPGNAIDASGNGPSDSGVYLASSGSDVLFFALSNEGTRSLRYTRWNGTGWSSWYTLVADTGGADHLAGYHSPIDGRIGLVWSTTTPAASVMGLTFPSAL